MNFQRFIKSHTAESQRKHPQNHLFTCTQLGLLKNGSFKDMTHKQPIFNHSNEAVRAQRKKG